MQPLVVSRPPEWVGGLILDRPGEFDVLTVSVPDVDTLTTRRFSDEVECAYRHLDRQIQQRHRHPLRIWNFVPGIQTPTADGNRYMAFNAGRLAAYRDWFGSAEAMAVGMPTASAVGTTDNSLWIHVLLADSPGRPVENPRQVPAYHYSRRFGTHPPCFARGTLFESRLLIGGTASIVGEDSRHCDSIEEQTRETLINIAALIASAGGCCESAALERLEQVRVHVREPHHASVVHRMLAESALGAASVEMVEAQLCRPELLVEIEGHASCA